MNLLRVLAILVVFASSTANKVPVLMWSQSRPLSDLPQAFAGNSIDSDTFQSKYLVPLANKAGHHVVAFVQDKLHMDDFTMYADVYNPFSDGGAFKNIKALMDEHFSVNLPSVYSAKSALDSLVKEFQGRVHRVSSPEQVSQIKMDDDKSYLILILLPATSQDKNEERAMARNDKKVGEMVKALNKNNIKYTALFTGENSERKTESTFKGRHLLATADNITGIFVNESQGQVYFYSRNIRVIVVQKEKDVTVETPIDFPTEEGKYNGSKTVGGNNTVYFQLETTDAVSNVSGAVSNYNVSFWFTVVKLSDRWYATNFTLYVSNSSDSGQVVIDEQGMSMANAEMKLPPIFSYHCSNISLYPLNMTKQYGIINFNGLQFQPFGIKNDQFSDAWDCVGFFTTPIWMGLFPVGIFTIILFYGMYMISQLSTMDRFDDPKGKTITVNVNE